MSGAKHAALGPSVWGGQSVGVEHFLLLLHQFLFFVVGGTVMLPAMDGMMCDAL